MFIVTQGAWESGVYISEQTARHVAESRSGAHFAEGAAIVWRMLGDAKKIFVVRYQRGAVGKMRQHGPRDTTTLGDPDSAA